MAVKLKQGEGAGSFRIDVEGLADRIARGEVGTAAQLDADFAVIDRLLAERLGWDVARAACV